MEQEPEIHDVDVVFRSKILEYALRFAVWTAVSLAWAVLIFSLFPFNESVMVAALAPAAAMFVYAIHIREEILSKFYQQFARANGYTYAKEDPTLRGEGATFSTGHSQAYSNVMRGTFREHPIVIFNFQFTTGHGRNRRTSYYTVFEVDYNRHLPKMFLRSDKARWSMVKPSFNDGRRLTLEGDFDNFFDLFCEEKFEIEALQVFTPDIMHKLQTNWHKLSLEFVNDKIYIYAKGYVTKKPDLKSMYELGQYLIEKLAPVLLRMESSVVAMKEKIEVRIK